MTVKEFRALLKGVKEDAPIVFIHRKGKPPFMGLDPVGVETVNTPDDRGVVVSHVVVSLTRGGKRNAR